MGRCDGGWWVIGTGATRAGESMSVDQISKYRLAPGTERGSLARTASMVLTVERRRRRIREVGRTRGRGDADARGAAPVERGAPGSTPVVRPNSRSSRANSRCKACGSPPTSGWY
ncbi:hypothetical protein ASG12_02430 [Williamsia sp. Leaf354]|nr:hypothetical protein ASG12_02430 [Williamsia sp. Leaf354]